MNVGIPSGGSRLEEALRTTTVALKVQVAGATKYGTGFFVTPKLVLTCAHVVVGPDHRPAAQVEGVWGNTTVRLTTSAEDVRPFDDGRGSDLALLRLGSPLPRHRWVCLGGPCDTGDELWAYGYPNTDYRGGDPLAFRYVGGSMHERGAELHKVAGGQVFPGHSGAPALNRRTGGVCGLIRTRQRPQAGAGEEYGARLIPAAVVLAVFPELAAAQHQAIEDNQAWLDLLEDDQIMAGGWRYPGPGLRMYLSVARDEAREHPYRIALPDAPSVPAVYLKQQIIRAGEDDSRSADYSWPTDETGSRLRLLQLWKSMRGWRHRLLDRDREPDQGQPTAGLPENFERAKEEWAGPTEDSSASAPIATDAIPELSPHALVLGGPGAGKSSLLRYMVETSAASWLNSRTGTAVPVRIPAETLIAPVSLAEAIHSAVMADLGTRLRARLSDDLFQHPPLPGVPWLVLVDGLDEILSRSERSRVIGAVLAADPTCYRFVVTSRPLDERELVRLDGLASEYWIQPFQRSQVQELAEGWFEALHLPSASSLSQRFLDELDRSRLTDLAQVPLLATMACIIFGQSPDQTLPRSRADLYESFVTLLMEEDHIRLYGHLPTQLRRQAGNAGEKAAERLISESRSLLEFIAYQRIDGSTEPLLELATPRLEALRPPQLPTAEWRRVLQELLRQSGVLVERFGSFSFIHQTVQEYLAACHLSREVSPSADWLSLGVLPDRESFVLFLSGVWARDGKDLDGPVAQILEHGTSIAAELAGALISDGVPLGAGIVTRTVELLARSVTNPEVHHTDQLLALQQLIEVDPRRGADLLVRISQDPRRGSWAARWLVDVDPGQGIALLRRLADDRTADPAARVRAADRLAGVDPAQGAELLDGLADDPTLPRSQQIEAAASIRHADPTRAAALLQRLATESGVETADRIKAAEKLAEAAPQQAAEVLADLAEGPDVPLTDRVTAATALALVDPSRGAALLHAFAADPSLKGSDRALAAGCLVMRGRDERDLDVLVGLVSDPSLDKEGHEAALAWLLELARGRGMELLASIAADPSRDGADRINAAERLAAGLGSEVGTELLKALAGDPLLPKPEHERAMQALAELRE